jgi:hypothetical protein
MKNDLLALLRKIKPVTLKSGVVRTLEEADLASVVGGLTIVHSTTYAGGYPSDSAD